MLVVVACLGMLTCATGIAQAGAEIGQQYNHWYWSYEQFLQWMWAEPTTTRLFSSPAAGFYGFIPPNPGSPNLRSKVAGLMPRTEVDFNDRSERRRARFGGERYNGLE